MTLTRYLRLAAILILMSAALYTPPGGWVVLFTGIVIGPFAAVWLLLPTASLAILLFLGLRMLLQRATMGSRARALIAAAVTTAIVVGPAAVLRIAQERQIAALLTGDHDHLSTAPVRVVGLFRDPDSFSLLGRTDEPPCGEMCLRFLLAGAADVYVRLPTMPGGAAPPPDATAYALVASQTPCVELEGVWNDARLRTALAALAVRDLCLSEVAPPSGMDLIFAHDALDLPAPLPGPRSDLRATRLTILRDRGGLAAEFRQTLVRGNVIVVPPMLVSREVSFEGPLVVPGLLTWPIHRSGLEGQRSNRRGWIEKDLWQHAVEISLHRLPQPAFEHVNPRIETILASGRQPTGLEFHAINALLRSVGASRQVPAEVEAYAWDLIKRVDFPYGDGMTHWAREGVLTPGGDAPRLASVLGRRLAAFEADRTGSELYDLTAALVLLPPDLLHRQLPVIAEVARHDANWHGMQQLFPVLGQQGDEGLAILVETLERMVEARPGDRMERITLGDDIRRVLDGICGAERPEPYLPRLIAAGRKLVTADTRYGAVPLVRALRHAGATQEMLETDLLPAAPNEPASRALSRAIDAQVAPCKTAPP